MWSSDDQVVPPGCREIYFFWLDVSRCYQDDRSREVLGLRAGQGRVGWPAGRHEALRALLQHGNGDLDHAVHSIEPSLNGCRRCFNGGKNPSIGVLQRIQWVRRNTNECRVVYWIQSSQEEQLEGVWICKCHIWLAFRCWIWRWVMTNLRGSSTFAHSQFWPQAVIKIHTKHGVIFKKKSLHCALPNVWPMPRGASHHLDGSTELQHDFFLEPQLRK